MKIKMRIITRMLVFFLLPAMVGLTCMSCVDFYLSRQAVTAQIEEELNLVAEGQVEAFSNVVEMLKSVVTNLADVKRILDVLNLVEKQGGFNAQNIPPDTARLIPAAQKGLESVAQHFTRVSGAGMVDVHGTVIAHTNKSFIGSTVKDRAYFKQAMEGKTGFENVQSRASKSLSTIVSRPVLENKKIVGMVYISVDLPNLAKTTICTIKISQTGLAFVYDSKGLLLMHPNADYVGDQDGQLPWVQKILASPQGLLEYVWKDVTKMASFKRVPGTDWTVVVGVEKDDVTAPITRMFRFSALLGITISIVVGLIIYLVARSLSNTLRGSAAIVTAVAGGNFTLSTQDNAKLDEDSERGDAIAFLAIGIRGMVANLEKLFTESAQKTASAEAASRAAEIATQRAEEAQKVAESAKRDGMLAAAQQLEQVVKHITTTADTLMHLITASEQGTERQSRRISETAVAMEEMNTTVVEVSRSASETSSLTVSTREKAQNGARLVEDSIKNIQQIQRDSLALKQDMTALGQNAQDISHIMSVISDIADQTNLLALNAAIEAARAGDAGRGFAVVADEVRKLAEKTMHSTNDVGNAIRAIQESSGKSIKQVEAAVSNIEHTTEQSLTSGTALGEIVEMMEVTADQVRAIATASEQQSATSEEINQSISQIDAIAQETAVAMREATTAVNDMVQQAAALNTLIEELKHG